MHNQWSILIWPKKKNKEGGGGGVFTITRDAENIVIISYKLHDQSRICTIKRDFENLINISNMINVKCMQPNKDKANQL